MPIIPNSRISRNQQTQESSGMVAIEQAIFTSARTSKKDGYQLVAWSPGVGAEDARQLAVWGPAHDSMIMEDPNDVSINFHPLGENKFCVSRTMLGGAEYSGRGGLQVYTHCFVLSATALKKFHNDPFRVMAAVLATRDLRPDAKLPNDLTTLTMVPVGAAVEPLSIESLIASKQQQKMVAWMHHALSNKNLFYTGNPEDSFLAAFFSLLPVAVRPQFSFSTSLRFSPRRAFRLVGLRNDEEEQKKASRHEGRHLFQFEKGKRLSDSSRHAWATLIQVALCQSQPIRAVECIGRLPGDVRIEKLPAIADRLRLEISNESNTPDEAKPESLTTDRVKLQIDRALGGDFAALESIHRSISAAELSQAMRVECSDYFCNCVEEKKLAESEPIVEILRLLLS